MANRGHGGHRHVEAEHGVRADYLRGDPSQEGPITRGMLALEAQSFGSASRTAPS